MAKNKEPKVVKLDENGNPIEKKKVDWKGILKKVAIGVGGVAVGVVTFCAIGVAMSLASDENPETEVVMDELGLFDDPAKEDSDSSGTNSEE